MRRCCSGRRPYTGASGTRRALALLTGFAACSGSTERVRVARASPRPAPTRPSVSSAAVAGLELRGSPALGAKALLAFERDGHCYTPSLLGPDEATPLLAELRAEHGRRRPEARAKLLEDHGPDFAKEDVPFEQTCSALVFATGSHRDCAHLFWAPFPTSPVDGARYLLKSHAPMAAGDATWHDGWVLHGAPPNRGAADRWGHVNRVVLSSLAEDVMKKRKKLHDGWVLHGAPPNGGAADKWGHVR
ncbi:hypothetical protein T492DRAFT_992936 [Pavlovales sp. CCMP2436]|nr:hypothetical protein T492DRAFT_992936 [Pavlovales sp. CCMP2436]